MTGNDYLGSVLAKYAVQTGSNSHAAIAAGAMMPMVRQWAGNMLKGAYLSGSYAKGTAIKGGTDVDLFISVDSSCPNTLQDIYDSLAVRVSKDGYPVRRQNVSIGTTVNGVAVDLVPGKKHPGNTNDHSLCLSKHGSWTKTNVVQHVALVADSGRLNEIRIMKIWRLLHSIEFPSFYLELSVLESLKGRASGDLARNVQTSFEYIANSLELARVVDPANTNNTVSDELTAAEKRVVALRAADAARATNWNDVVR